MRDLPYYRLPLSRRPVNNFVEALREATSAYCLVYENARMFKACELSVICKHQAIGGHNKVREYGTVVVEQKLTGR